MADSIQHFYPKLVTLPQVREAILAEFGEGGPANIQAMAAGESLGSDADDVEDLIISFVSENASVIAEFEASGKTPGDPVVSTDYLRQHHPEAMALIDKMGGAPGFEQSDFLVQVLRYEFLFVIVADEFEDEFFDVEELALSFTRDNYEPWIANKSE